MQRYCQFVGFRKLQKCSDTDPPNLTSERCGESRFPKFFDYLKNSSEGVYWLLEHRPQRRIEELMHTPPKPQQHHVCWVGCSNSCQEVGWRWVCQPNVQHTSITESTTHVTAALSSAAWRSITAALAALTSYSRVITVSSYTSPEDGVTASCPAVTTDRVLFGTLRVVHVNSSNIL